MYHPLLLVMGCSVPSAHVRDSTVLALHITVVSAGMTPGRAGKWAQGPARMRLTVSGKASAEGKDLREAMRWTTESAKFG